MRLQVRGLKSEIRIRHAVAAIESIVGKLGHEGEYLLGLLLLDTTFNRARDELLLMHRHLFTLLLAHRATHEVGFAKCIAGKLLRELHYLLLVHDDAVGIVEDLLHLRHEITHGFFAVVALDEFIDHAAIEWSRTIESV